MRISDWSSDVCSSDLIVRLVERDRRVERFEVRATDRLGIAEADLDIVADPETRRRVGKPVVIDGVGGQPVIFAIFRLDERADRTTGADITHPDRKGVV